MPETIDSTPNPQIQSVVATIIRIILLVWPVGAAAVGLSETNAAIIAATVSMVVGGVWELYEQFRQAKMRHLAAVASARGARAIQHKDYVS